jgi:hypothetical protein
MRTLTALVAAIATIAAGTLGFAAAPKPGDPPPYTPAREVVTKTVQVATDAVTVTPATIDCPAGKVVVSGGFNAPYDSTSGTATVMQSYPADADTWAFLFTPYTAVRFGFPPPATIYAVCVNP